MTSAVRIAAVLVALAMAACTARAQVRSPGGFVVGIETVNALSAQPGMFSGDPGLSIGAFISPDVARFSGGLLSLRIEAGITKAVDFRPNHETQAVWDSKLYRYVLDLKFRYDLLELTVMPEYMVPVGDNGVLTCYAGPSGGLCREILTVAEVSRALADSLLFFGIGYGPYGEYNKDAGGWSTGFNVGATVRFSPLIVDARYKYTVLTRRTGVVSHLNNVFLAVGVLL